MKQVIEGQLVEVDQKASTIEVDIKSFFNTAGKLFKWSGDPKGIGISRILVRHALVFDYDIIIRVKGTAKRFKPENILDFCEDHNSFWKASNTPELCVIRWNDEIE